MAVKIRLQRHGRKKRPFYRIVAADCRSARNGAFIERLGHYNPLTDPAEIVIHSDKALKWLRNGAQPTDTAKNLLSKVGVWKRFHDEKLGLIPLLQLALMWWKARQISRVWMVRGYRLSLSTPTSP